MEPKNTRTTIHKTKELVTDAVKVGSAVSTGNYVRAAILVVKNKKIRKLLLCLLLLIMLVPLISVFSLTALTSSIISHTIMDFTSSETEDYKQQCSAWTKTIRWVSGYDSSGLPIYETGLSPEQLKQVTDQGANLSFGLILALKAFGDHDIRSSIQALSPKEISFRKMTKRTTTTHIPKSTDDPSTSQTVQSTEESIWMLSSIRTYNGLHEFRIEEQTTTHETTAEDGSTTIVATTTPSIVGETWTKDYGPLYAESQKVGFSSKPDDQVYLFRQAMLYDPSFGDPLANSVLQEMIGMIGDAGLPGDSGGRPPVEGVPLPDASIAAALKEAMLLKQVDPRIWEAGMTKLIMAESQGNPRAWNPNPVWYSAQWGFQHAAGLCQVMPPTFQAHSLPGHKDIWNPLDNIIAAIGYIEGKYGTVNNIHGIGDGELYIGY